MAKVFIHTKEADFVKRIHDGDRAAEREFFEYCYDYCIRSQSKYDMFSDDRFQDAMVQIWTEIQDGRIFIKDGKVWRLPKASFAIAAPMTCSLRTFLVDICNNQIAKEKRKPKPTDITNGNVIGEGDEESKLDLMQIVNENISIMSATCREILTLCYVKGLELDQIMRLRGVHVSKKGLKTSKSKCLQKLKQSCRSSYNALI